MPLNPPAQWKAVKSFAQAVAEVMVTLEPKEFVSVSGEKNCKGKIFVTWLRNRRGATSVASYSLRARASTEIAMPIAWGELGRVKSSDAYTIKKAWKKIRGRPNRSSGSSSVVSSRCSCCEDARHSFARSLRPFPN